jgi:hypothetical protein
MTAPICISCQAVARITDGSEVYPHRPDLHHKTIWKCDGCEGYVGCHPGTWKPLGTPANAEVRRARMLLHNDRVDPLWATADKCGLYRPENVTARWKIRKHARHRVYAYLAEKLGVPFDQCHVGMFDLTTCRRAWTALTGVTYPEIREWWKARKEAA